MAMMRSAALLFLALLPFAVPAAQFRDFGPYRIHYNAFPSTAIGAEVARTYGFNRSRYRGMLNITVQHQGGTSAVWPATEAEVDAVSTNAMGQKHRIDMQEIREGDTIYYIGEFPVRNEDKLDFSVKVRPTGTKNPYELNFSQQFFTE